ncbi:MAG: WecB/TagA/CpsF family glycosyltransferase [Iphinoe sp. HA4291-MV1]|jgi:exopolysaccharide biosynthesis WecB/TagA/CpsF family protein|nr:WecB/TagA/CpsF family glycosyltransferase [Iphinoe sp. HA4291-MV1]
MNKVRILNLEIDNLSKAEFLEKLQSGVVFTPNVDHLIKLQKDLDFLQAYSISDYKVCDSQILIYASKFLGTPIKEKISGSDLFPAFYNYHKNNEDIKIFLLGAGIGIASKAQNEINRKTGRNIVVASYSPPFGFEKNEEECQNIINMINSSDATVLVIGLGAPKQEKWLYKYKSMLPQIKIFMALGATIDFEAGNLKRAPKWMSEVGLEWLFRILREPKRLWKRYLVDDVPFLILILKQKFNLYITKKRKNNNPIWQIADRL